MKKTLFSFLLLAGLAPSAVFASVLFDFNSLAAGINSTNGSTADSIDNYMTGVYGSSVTVALGAKTMTSKAENPYPRNGLYLGNSDGATDRGQYSGSAFYHAGWLDTFLINRWNATSLASSVRDRIVITFNAAPITAVEFDWEIFPMNGSGVADFTFKADGTQIFYTALTTSSDKQAGDLGHFSHTFSAPVTKLEFIDWTDAPIGIDNLRVTRVPEPGSATLFGAALAAFALSRRRRQR